MLRQQPNVSGLPWKPGCKGRVKIFSLVYVSSASGLYDKDVYKDIALKSDLHNRDHGITGMLLIYNETIIQFLEGHEIEVKTLYSRIEKDTRHKGPIVVSTRDLDAREFSEWSMGYKEPIDIQDPNFIFSLDLKTLERHFPEFSSSTTQALISSFKSSSGLTAF